MLYLKADSSYAIASQNTNSCPSESQYHYQIFHIFWTKSMRSPYSAMPDI